MQISNQIPVNLTGGPLSYRYRFHEIHIHYGLHDQFGSEHSVEGYTFPAEVRKFFKNIEFEIRHRHLTRLVEFNYRGKLNNF